MIADTLGNLSTLDGLAPEGVYGGVLALIRTKGLVDVKALMRTHIRGVDLIIDGTDSLESLDGLQGATQLRSISINNNQVLKSLSGLANVTRVEGDVVLRYNPRLTGVGGIRDSKRKTEREPPHQALSSGVYRFT